MGKKTKKVTRSGNNRKKVDPLKINMARILFFLNAILWFAYGIYIYYDMAVVNNNKSSADVVTLFVFANSGLMLFSGIMFGKPKKWIYYFALAVAAFNTVICLLTLFLFFLVSFFIDLLILLTIIPLRKLYLPNS